MPWGAASPPTLLPQSATLQHRQDLIGDNLRLCGFNGQKELRSGRVLARPLYACNSAASALALKHCQSIFTRVQGAGASCTPRTYRGRGCSGLLPLLGEEDQEEEAFLVFLVYQEHQEDQEGFGRAPRPAACSGSSDSVASSSWPAAAPAFHQPP